MGLPHPPSQAPVANRGFSACALKEPHMTEVTPSKLEELPPGTRDWLADLRPDELKTLQAVVEMPADEVREAFKMVQDLRTVGRFTKWVTITFVGLFLATVVLYENIIKVIGYLRGGPTS